MIRCREVATLLSTDQLGKQSGWHRVKVQIHLAICVPCRRFRRQLTVLRRTAAAIDARYDAEIGPEFEDRVRERALRES